MTRFKGIHHPAFITGNLEKTVRFWRDLLGMRLVYTTGREGERQAFFDAGNGNRVTFFEFPDAEAVPYHRPGEPQSGPVVFDHVAIEVGCEDDLWEMTGRLEAAGIPISDVTDHGFCHSLYSYDPNGIAVEFLSPVPGVDMDANPRLADDSPTRVETEGPDPLPGKWPPPDDIPEEERDIIPGWGHDDFPEREDR